MGRSSNSTYIFLTANVVGALCLVAAIVGHSNQSILLALGGLGALLGTWNQWRQHNQTNRLHEQQVDLQKREERFRAISDGAAAGLFLADPSGRVMQSNGALQSMLGYSEEQLRQLSLFDYVLRADAMHLGEVFRQFETGKLRSQRVEIRYVRPDQRVVWTHVTLNLVTTEAGPNYVAGVVQDISDQQHGATVQEIEQLFRLSFDSSPLGIGHTDVSGRFLFVNRRLCEIFGYSREELFGREISMVLHPEDCQEVQTALRRLMHAGIGEEWFRVRLLRRDGSSLLGTAVLSLVRQPNGDIKHATFTVDDGLDHAEGMLRAVVLRPAV